MLLHNFHTIMNKRCKEQQCYFTQIKLVHALIKNVCLCGSRSTHNHIAQQGKLLFWVPCPVIEIDLFQRHIVDIIPTFVQLLGKENFKSLCYTPHRQRCHSHLGARFLLLFFESIIISDPCLFGFCTEINFKFASFEKNWS